MGPFIADFVCHGARLEVELYGGVHDAPDVIQRDQDRRLWIEGRSYLMLRFSNSEVLRDAKKTADEISRIALSRLKPGG